MVQSLKMNYISNYGPYDVMSLDTTFSYKQQMSASERQMISYLKPTAATVITGGRTPARVPATATGTMTKGTDVATGTDTVNVGRNVKTMPTLSVSQCSPLTRTPTTTTTTTTAASTTSSTPSAAESQETCSQGREEVFQHSKREIRLATRLRPETGFSLRFLLLLFLLQTHFTGGARVPPQFQTKETDKPIFTEEVVNATVVVGRNVTLRCSVEKLGGFKIAWVKADTQTLLSIENTMITRNYRMHVSHSDNRTWYLHITNVKRVDRGNYMCQVNTVPMTSIQGHLEVVVPPNILDNETSAEVEVEEDSPANLSCVASGYPIPEVHFRREDGLPVRQGIENVHRDPMMPNSTAVGKTTSTLSFKAVTRLDMGHYLCIANNSIPPMVSKRLRLKVRYREPEVIVSHQMIGVYRGDDVTLDCTVTAYPRPVVLWQDKAGQMIITGGRVEISEKQMGEFPPKIQVQLTIRALTKEDITSYSCNASLGHENRQKSLTVQLNEIQRPSTEPSRHELLYNGEISKTNNVQIHSPRRAPHNETVSMLSTVSTAGHQSKTLRKIPPKRNNDIAEPYDKPTNYIPEVFLKTSRGHSSVDRSSDTSGSSQSQTSFQISLILIGWFVLLAGGRGAS